MARVEFIGVCKIYSDNAPAVRHLDLVLEDGEFLCVLGPSGCGKSSTLRMLAGLESVTKGDIHVDGERINDVPPQQRDMAMVFENYALYPHLSVFENIAMPLAARRVPPAEIETRVREVAETLQITEHLRKRPAKLSGGQRQRVALGRAIVRTPRLFLMDEPLGHLEAYLRVQLRSEIRRIHERLGATTFYITHDQEEAAAVSDRIVVMHDGALQQAGSLLDLLDRPVNKFVASFIGDLPINFMPAAIEANGSGLGVRVGDALLPLSAEQSARLKDVPETTPVELGVRPDDTTVDTSFRTDTLEGHVLVLEPQGDYSVVVTETAVGRVSAVVSSAQVPAVDDSVRLALDMRRAHLFAPDGRNILRSV